MFLRRELVTSTDDKSKVVTFHISYLSMLLAEAAGIDWVRQSDALLEYRLKERRGNQQYKWINNNFVDVTSTARV